MAKKKNNMLKIIIGAVVLLTVVLLIGKKAGWFGKTEVLSVFTEKPEKRTIVETTNANGKIQPEVEVKISSEVSGEITELPYKEGMWVEKGVLLARIKPDTYISMKERAAASVNSANARLLQSKAQLKQAELAFNRSKQLHEQKAISDSEFETAKTNHDVAGAELKAAEFNVESAEASLKEANENLLKTTIYAPISGTISKLNVELGERVVGTIQMTGTEILRIANLNRMEARVNVNENDIVKVKLGDTAMVEVDAYLNRKFKGVVTQIANTANSQGTTTDQVTSFEVRIFILASSYNDLLKSDRQSPFRPGMSTTVDILTNTKSNIICIPIQAVTTRGAETAKGGLQKVEENNKATAETSPSTDKPKDSELKEVVFIVRNDTARMVNVTTGIQDNQYIEILSGIKGEEDVVTSPYSAIARKLNDGIKVAKSKTKNEVFKPTTGK